jgi:hypothetical protein
MWPFTRPDLDKIDLHLQFWTAEPDTPYTLRLTVDKLDVVEALGVVRGVIGLKPQILIAALPLRQIRRLARAGAGVVEAADLQRFLARLAAAADAFDADAARVGGGAGQCPCLQVDQHQAAAAVGHGPQFADLEGQDAPTRGRTGHMRGRGHGRHLLPVAAAATSDGAQTVSPSPR